MQHCSVEGCTNEASVPGSARGLCRAHYRRWQRYGDENEPTRRVYNWHGVSCAGELGCDGKIYGNGLCAKHHGRVRRRIDKEGNRRRAAAFKERYRLKQEALMGRPRPEQCELCGEVGYGRHPTIVFDHCHATGKPRGWLCDRCNKTLGLVKDRPDLLRAMVAYLEHHNVGFVCEAA